MLKKWRFTNISNISVNHFIFFSAIEDFKYEKPESKLKKLINETSNYDLMKARYNFKQMFMDTKRRRKILRYRISWYNKKFNQL